ncbi:MAG: hypothetical protein RL456_3608 [Pseudomonadota bacterium]|jgi:3',5'-cyclic AMP phosphodiesterase CpdA
MKLIHLTDTHLLAQRDGLLYGTSPHARLRDAIDSVVRLHADADACLLTGDLADAGSPAAYRDLAALLARLPMPFHLLPGNHDDRDALARAFPDHVGRDEDGFLQREVPLPDGGRLLLLDSVDAGRPQGLYCAARRRWLAARLEAAAASGAPVWLAMHHPPMPVGIPSMDLYGLRDPGPLGALLRAHRDTIRHIFCGHVHRAIAGTWQGVSFSCAKSVNHQVALDLVRTDEVPGSGEAPGYGVILADGGRVIVHGQDVAPEDGGFVL